MDTSILEGLGLTNGEVKAYLTLLEVGQTKVGVIIEKSGLASSAVHNYLNNLSEKGLVTHIKKGKIKYYKAVSPDQLLSFIEEKKKRLKEILPELKSKHQKSQEKEEAEVFEGSKGIIAMLNSLIENVSRGEEYLFFAINVEEHNEEIQDFLESYDVKRKDKGLIIKGCASPHLNKLFSKRKNIKMKYPVFPILSNLSICKNKVAIFSWGEKPIGYLIHSKQISNAYKQYFSQIWDMS